jgi:multiple antibiotic resistance protein
MTLGPVEIFILFFVTLGPLKLIGPFAHATSTADAKTVRQVALRAFALSTICVVAAGFVGRALLHNWHISLAAMTLTGGIIFFLVALRQLLQQYETFPALAPESTVTPMVAALELTFPVGVTPYGIAAVIALFTASADSARSEVIVALLVAVMVLNLFAMLFVHRILNGATALVLQIVGAVLGVLQVALSVQIMLRGLRELGVPLQ